MADSAVEGPQCPRGVVSARSHEEVPVWLNRAGIRAGTELAGSTLKLQFAQGNGYRRVDLVFTW
jgi:hypothetical protein